MRPDVHFWLLTKRAHRIRECLPSDWRDGWDNVSINVTTENQRRVEERLPILLDIPAKHKGVMIAPFIGEVDLDVYLASGQLETVFADGEKYGSTRPLHYEWVKRVYEQCKKHDVPFSFFWYWECFHQGQPRIPYLQGLPTCISHALWPTISRSDTGVSHSKTMCQL